MGATSEVWALDLDRDEEKGLNGFATFANLAQGKEPLPDTATNLTPRGGKHLLFRWTGPVKSRAGLAHGVDTRGDGSYLIMPPSRRGDGRTYEEIVAVWPPAEAPPWLAELVADKRPKNGRADTEPNEHTETPRKNGHDSAYAAAAAEGRDRCVDFCRARRPERCTE